MNSANQILDDSKRQVLADYKFHIYTALIGELNPSLRAICINWLEDKEDIEIIFYHDGILTDAIRYHYEYIEMEATSSTTPRYLGIQIGSNLKLISLPFPALIPDSTEVVFQRQEPNRLAPLSQNFLPLGFTYITFLILKVNEALRGRVTKDLRSVYLKWESSFNEAIITFVHDSEVINQIVYEQYQEIFKIATSVKWITKDDKLVIPKLEVISTPYPEKILYPKEITVLYARKEPFIDPVEE